MRHCGLRSSSSNWRRRSNTGGARRAWPAEKFQLLWFDGSEDTPCEGFEDDTRYELYFDTAIIPGEISQANSVDRILSCTQL